MDKPAVPSPVPQTLENLEIPNDFTDFDIHILAGCFDGFCFVGGSRNNPPVDIPSVVERSSLRDGPRLGFPGLDLLGRTWSDKRELDEVQAVWDAARRRCSLTHPAD